MQAINMSKLAGRCSGRPTVACAKRRHTLRAAANRSQCRLAAQKLEHGSRNRLETVTAQMTAVAMSLSFSAPAMAAADLAAPENAAKAVDNGWLNPIVNSLNFVLGNVELPREDWNP